MRSDEQLLACYREAGEREALDELVERHLGRVRAMIYPMVLDAALADDLTQEVFLRAFRGLDSFRGTARFSTWLYRITMNTAHGFLARQRRSPVRFQRELPDGGRPSGEHPDAAAMRKELQTAVAATIGDLSPKLRAAVVLTMIEQFDVDEAARIEGCTRATMYWRIHQARKRLRERLEKYMG